MYHNYYRDEVGAQSTLLVVFWLESVLDGDVVLSVTDPLGVFFSVVFPSLVGTSSALTFPILVVVSGGVGLFVLLLSVAFASSLVGASLVVTSCVVRSGVVVVRSEAET